MDRYRSPQLAHTASLQISSPRSLRPRDERLPEPTPQHLPPHLPVIPGEFATRYQPTEDDIHDTTEVGGSQTAHSELETNSDVTAPGTTQSDGKRFVGGFWRGLRRIPQAMAKHHSRESLYAQYAAETEVASRRASQYPGEHPRVYSCECLCLTCRAASTVLSDIPEDHFDESISQRPPSRLPPPRPIFPPYRNSTVSESNLDEFGSPVYRNSDLDPPTPKEGSEDAAAPPKDTWAYYVYLAETFFIHIYNLPWSSPRVVSDYVPMRHGRSKGRKTPVSWYAPRGILPQVVEKVVQPVVFIAPTPPSGDTPGLPELMVMPPTPTLGLTSSEFGGSGDYGPPRPAYVLPESVYSSDAATAVRPTRSPMTATSVGYGFPSPGASSHGQGRHAASYSWYYSSPPPFQPFGQYYEATETATGYVRTEPSVGMSSPA